MFIIELHGKENFEEVYKIMNKYRENRFSEEKQKLIQNEVNEKLLGKKGVSANDVNDLIGLISSFMIIEDYKREIAA